MTSCWWVPLLPLALWFQLPRAFLWDSLMPALTSLASSSPAFSSSSSLIFPEWKVYPGWVSSCFFGNDGQIKHFPSYLHQIIKAPSGEIPHSAANAGEELKGERPWMNIKGWKIGNRPQMIPLPVSNNCSISPGNCRSFLQCDEKWKWYSKGPKSIQLLMTLSNVSLPLNYTSHKWD